MLADVRGATSERVRELRRFYETIEVLAPVRPGPVTIAAKIAKGLFFVQLYSIIEYCVTAVVQSTIAVINAEGAPLANIKPVVLSLALHRECQAVATVGPTKMWLKRRELFTRVHSTDPAILDENVIPTTATNLRFEQLQEIWDTFGLSTPVLPRMDLKGRLAEITEHRNAIAHGREPASSIGARYSVSDLESRLIDVNALCEYIILAFEGYLKGNEFCTRRV